MSLQARRCGVTGAGARISLWSSWGLRPTPTPRKTYMKPAFCSVLQQVLGANLAKETSVSQQILLKTKFKPHQLPSPPNLPDASHRGNLASRPAVIAAPWNPVCFPSAAAAAFSAVHVSLFSPPARADVGQGRGAAGNGGGLVEGKKNHVRLWPAEEKLCRG